MSTRYPDMTTVDVAIPTPDGKSVAETITITVSCRLEEKTGEAILGGEALRTIDLVKARYMGILLPHEIAQLRGRLGMSQQEMCGLLQIGAKSYSRWETGRERPSRSMNLLLRGLNDGKLSIPYLRSLGERQSDWWAVAYNWPRKLHQRKPYTIDTTGYPAARPQCLEEGANATKQSAA